MKVGLKKSALPEPFHKFNRNPLVIIFKIFGGLSLISLYYRLIPLDTVFFYISIYIAILHITIIIGLAVIRVYYIIKRWKNKELEVRNSPLDEAATLAAKIMTTAIGIAATGGSVTSCMALGLGIDELLIANKYVPHFKLNLEMFGDRVADKGFNGTIYEWLYAKHNLCYIPRHYYTTPDEMVARSKGLSNLAFHFESVKDIDKNPVYNFNAKEKQILQITKLNLDVLERKQLTLLMNEHLKECAENNITGKENIAKYDSKVRLAAKKYLYGNIS